MQEKEFKALIDKFLNGTATVSEQRAVQSFFDSYQKEVQEYDPALEAHGIDEEEIYQRVMKWHATQKSAAGTATTLAPTTLWPGRIWRVAAAILTLATIGVFLYTRYAAPDVRYTASSIQPGSNKATLTLSNGQIINLSESKKGVLITDDKIVYNDGSFIKGLEPNTSTPQHLNTIQTPRGGQYQLTLPDGTKVFLNAASSIEYPSSFEGVTVRDITVTGEAYFDVAPDPTKPFIITTGSVTTTVLGTTFNVKAYENEPLAITLETGKVKVETATRQHVNTSTPQYLTANQQVQLINNELTLTNDPYAIQEALAWRSGLFRFEAASLETILKQVSRWYDVDVVYEGDFSHLTFAAVMPRKDELSGLLRVLELTGLVHFEIKDNTVTVKGGKMDK